MSDVRPESSDDVTPVTAPPESGASVATDEAPAEPVTVKGLDRRRGLSGAAWVPWVIAVLAIAAAVFFFLQRNQARAEWTELRAAEQTRTEVSKEANVVALRLTTFKGEEIEDWYADIRKTATGKFADQLTQVFNQQTRDTLRDIGVVSVGEMQDIFVQDVDGDEATVFALVKQTYVNSSTPDPVEDFQRMDMTLERVDGRWLASDVVVLGPNGVVAPTDAQESVPNAEGDQ